MPDRDFWWKVYSSSCTLTDWATRKRIGVNCVESEYASSINFCKLFSMFSFFGKAKCFWPGLRARVPDWSMNCERISWLNPVYEKS